MGIDAYKRKSITYYKVILGISNVEDEEETSQHKTWGFDTKDVWRTRDYGPKVIWMKSIYAHKVVKMTINSHQN